MNSEEDNVVLQLEENNITCSKQVLKENSDYFKAMFDGNFVESNKSKVKIRDVSFEAMSLILKELWNDDNVLSEAECLLILEAVSMLQFVKIQSKCVERLTELLAPSNCVSIWKLTEHLHITPLCLKAKCMALDEFPIIKNGDTLLSLNLQEIHSYLGHVCLNTNDEFDVFQMAMKWWWSWNSTSDEINTNNVLLKLLSCINFNNINETYIKEMLVYPDLKDNIDIVNVLNCILKLTNFMDTSEYTEQQQNWAKHILDSKWRRKNELPCVLAAIIKYTQSDSESGEKKEYSDVVVYDKFKRKRVFKKIEYDKNDDVLAAGIYDPNNGCFDMVCSIDSSKVKSLDGFKVIGYKEFILLYGGEFLIGKGNWNKNFWVYDTFKERWSRRTVLPCPRRHFQTCIVNDIIFIIGGTGHYRVIQDNMLGYNFPKDTWAEYKMLPCPSRQIKCCKFKNQLFILNISDKCGYFWGSNELWTKIDIVDSEDILKKHFINEYTCFEYKNSLFIKGNILVELKIMEKKLTIVSSVEVVKMCCDKMDSVVCDSIVYTLYRCRADNDVGIGVYTYNFEEYDLETKVLVNSTSLSVDAVIVIDNEDFYLYPQSQLFSFRPFSILKEDELINENFILT